jgi:hypothetical protein
MIRPSVVRVEHVVSMWMLDIILALKEHVVTHLTVILLLHSVLTISATNVMLMMELAVVASNCVSVEHANTVQLGELSVMDNCVVPQLTHRLINVYLESVALMMTVLRKSLTVLAIPAINVLKKLRTLTALLQRYASPTPANNAQSEELTAMEEKSVVNLIQLESMLVLQAHVAMISMTTVLGMIHTV